MGSLSIIFISVLLLVVFLFPLWCAILMRIFCKKISTRFIIYFLGIVCSLPIAVSSFFQAKEMHARMGMEEMIRMYSLVMFPLMTFCISYCVAKTLAHAGIVVVDKAKGGRRKSE